MQKFSFLTVNVFQEMGSTVPPSAESVFLRFPFLQAWMYFSHFPWK